MIESYTEPDDDEPRREITVEATFQGQFEPGNEPDPEKGDNPSFFATHFEHPNGEEGIFLVYSGPIGAVMEPFDIELDVPDEQVIVPFKHKADGGYNFCSYDYTETEVVLEVTDAMFEEIQQFFIDALEE